NNIGVADAARRVNPRTRAIVPVHLHGLPADMDGIAALGRQAGLTVIEDAAQAHGALYKGRAVGTLGAMGAFSLNSTKNLPAGEGGLFVTDSEELYARAARVRRSEEHTSELQSRGHLVCRRLLEKNKDQSAT